MKPILWMNFISTVTAALILSNSTFKTRPLSSKKKALWDETCLSCNSNRTKNWSKTTTSLTLACQAPKQLSPRLIKVKTIIVVNSSLLSRSGQMPVSTQIGLPSLKEEYLSLNRFMKTHCRLRGDLSLRLRHRIYLNPCRWNLKT